MAVRRAFALLALASSADGARVRDAKVDGEVISAGVGSRAANLWNQYASAANAAADRAGRGLQTGCQPQMHTHRGTYRGAVMLFHGFTACGQQFEKLVPLLTARGYTVFTPVNPGHGYNYESRPDGTFDDYIADLPQEEEEYREFGREMHEIMQSANGQKVLFGMSLGGGIAAWVNHLGGYDRALLAAPMILASGLLNNVISLANRYPWRRHQVQSWGEGCELERAAGRAGICHFTAAIGAAARNLGQQHSSSVNSGVDYSQGDVQIMFVDADAAVSTNAIIALGLKYGIDSTSAMICGMDANVGHSFLSPYDNVDEDKYWLNETTQMVADYLTQGRPVPQGGGSSQSQGYPRCDVQHKPR